MPNQIEGLENHHPDDYDSIIECNDGFPSVTFNLPNSQEDFDLKYLDLESISVEEDVIMETSSSPHYPLCSTFCNSSTCEEYTPCCLCSSSNELDFKLTPDSEVIHDEEEGNKLIKYPFHSLSFPIFHEENSSIQVAHDICLIYPSLEVKLEESFDLGNMFVENVNYDQICDVHDFHLGNNDLVEITDGSFPYIMHDLIQSLISHSTILESSRTYEEAEALQLSLMLMSGSRESGKIPELSQIRIFSHDYFLCMVSLDVNPFLKDICYFEYGSFNFQDLIFGEIEELVSVSSSSCKYLITNSSFKCIPFMDKPSCEVDHSKNYL